MQIYHFANAKQVAKETLLLSKMLKIFMIKGLLS